VTPAPVDHLLQPLPQVESAFERACTTQWHGFSRMQDASPVHSTLLQYRL
jgi:hypothetical protein